MTRDLDRLWKLATERFLLGADSLHGPNHWRRVEQNAIRLADDARVDRDIVRVFAILHDSCRVNEHHDPQHGPHAAEWAKALHGNELSWVIAAGFGRLIAALSDHDRGRTSEDPLIGCCWDADRLDLWRVGITPHPKFMSTRLGKSLCHPGEVTR